MSVGVCNFKQAIVQAAPEGSAEPVVTISDAEEEGTKSATSLMAPPPPPFVTALVTLYVFVQVL